LTIAL